VKDLSTVGKDIVGVVVGTGLKASGPEEGPDPPQGLPGWQRVASCGKEGQDSFLPLSEAAGNTFGRETLRLKFPVWRGKSVYELVRIFSVRKVFLQQI